jgi:ketosteroid isomerase-like protein
MFRRSSTRAPARVRRAARLLITMTALSLGVGMTTATATAPAAPSTDEAVLRDLNANYIRSFLESDAAWYDAHLTDDFTCVRTDGSVLDRAAFLAGTKAGNGGTESYTLSEVTIRIHGDAALVGALGTWRRKDGTSGKTRYIDVYVRKPGGWSVASAQLTRAG